MLTGNSCRLQNSFSTPRTPPTVPWPLFVRKHLATGARSRCRPSGCSQARCRRTAKGFGRPRGIVPASTTRSRAKPSGDLARSSTPATTPNARLLAEVFPSHVVCARLGNSEDVATKHYDQFTEAHFAAANGTSSEPASAPKAPLPSAPPAGPQETDGDSDGRLTGKLTVQVAATTSTEQHESSQRLAPTGTYAAPCNEVPEPAKLPSGWGGIRTHERLSPLPVFKTGAFNRSATHPNERGPPASDDFDVSGANPLAKAKTRRS